jgi:hypothetical protein
MRAVLLKGGGGRGNPDVGGAVEGGAGVASWSGDSRTAAAAWLNRPGFPG